MPKAFVPITECVFQSAIEHLNANVEKAQDGVQSTRVSASEMRNLFSFATKHRDFLLITYVQLNDQRQPREPADRIGACTKVNRVSGIDRRRLPNRTGSELPPISLSLLFENK